MPPGPDGAEVPPASEEENCPPPRPPAQGLRTAPGWAARRGDSCTCELERSLRLWTHTTHAGSGSRKEKGRERLQMVWKGEEGGSGGRRGEPVGRMEAGRTDRVGPVLASRLCAWGLPEPAPRQRVGLGMTHQQVCRGVRKRGYLHQPCMTPIWFKPLASCKDIFYILKTMNFLVAGGRHS